ncbi:MAG: DUF5667 domain-containing protein [Actinomycetota bacterium]
MNARDHDRLDEALDRLVQGIPASAPEGLESLLETARVAREAFVVEVPELVARRHLAAMGADEPLVGARARRHRVAVTLLAAAIGVALMAGSAVAASSGALPGQLLYPVKRAVEKIDLAVHRDPASRARLHLQFAERRLEELRDLLAMRRAGQNVDIGAAMSAYEQELAHVQDAVAADALGQDLQVLLGNVQDELTKHLTVLTDLYNGGVPEQARAEIQDAITHAQSARDNVMQGRTNGGKPDGTPGGGPPSVSPGKSTSSHGR